jgi:HEPN superfamily RiboL-PSP-like protein
LQRFRLKLDKELVQWRHSVAHGDQPDLSTLDISDHIDFASHLLLVLADEFQAAMLQRV